MPDSLVCSVISLPQCHIAISPDLSYSLVSLEGSHFFCVKKLKSLCLWILRHEYVLTKITTNHMCLFNQRSSSSDLNETSYTKYVHTKQLLSFLTSLNHFPPNHQLCCFWKKNSMHKQTRLSSCVTWQKQLLEYKVLNHIFQNIRYMKQGH